eukprot:scaffold97_cov375-Prasinococcus_capsulatus_cf.AAC.5
MTKDAARMRARPQQNDDTLAHSPHCASTTSCERYLEQCTWKAPATPCDYVTVQDSDWHRQTPQSPDERARRAASKNRLASGQALQVARGANEKAMAARAAEDAKQQLQKVGLPTWSHSMPGFAEEVNSMCVAHQTEVSTIRKDYEAKYNEMLAERLACEEHLTEEINRLRDQSRRYQRQQV